NNSAGTRSVVYGKTLDYVLELTVVLADGSVVELRPLEDAELEAKCARSDLEGEGYRTVRRLARDHAEEIRRRYPRLLRRVGGYNQDAFVGGYSGIQVSEHSGLVMTASLNTRIPELQDAYANS